MTFEIEKQTLKEELHKRLNDFFLECEKTQGLKDAHIKEEVAIRQWYESELKKLVEKYNMI